MTRMTNSELVVGKLTASQLNVFAMLAASLPVFMLTPCFGGVSFEQVGRVFAVTVLRFVGLTETDWLEEFPLGDRPDPCAAVAG